MPLVHINADLKETNKILERLTQAVERFLLEQFKVRMGHCIQPAPDPHPELEPTVQYHTDEDTLREDLIALKGWQEPEMTEEHIDPNV